MKIKVVDLSSSKVFEEKVYGEKFIDFLYKSSLGKVFSPLLTLPIASRLYGRKMDSTKSKSQIISMIAEHRIDTSKFIKTSNCNIGWNTFNEFFIRKYKREFMSFVQGQSLPAFCEGRYFAWNSEGDIKKLPVKGYELNIKEILGGKNHEDFMNGPVVVCRLAPVDYHRFHFPDDCKVLDSYAIAGKLHSVNPLALKSKKDILIINERQVSILETTNFGKLAMIEVGAVCVGKIVQTYNSTKNRRGDEKGYFKFGGSTVVILGQRGKWSPSKELISNTEKGLESYAKIGTAIGASS